MWVIHFPFKGTSSGLTKFKERASLMAQIVKNLPAMQETWV